jgi:hypothetical protein
MSREIGRLLAEAIPTITGSIRPDENDLRDPEFCAEMRSGFRYVLGSVGDRRRTPTDRLANVMVPEFEAAADREYHRAQERRAASASRKRQSPMERKPDAARRRSPLDFEMDTDRPSRYLDLTELSDDVSGVSEHEERRHRALGSGRVLKVDDDDSERPAPQAGGNFVEIATACHDGDTYDDDDDANAAELLQIMAPCPATAAACAVATVSSSSSSSSSAASPVSVQQRAPIPLVIKRTPPSRPAPESVAQFDGDKIMSALANIPDSAVLEPEAEYDRSLASEALSAPAPMTELEQQYALRLNHCILDVAGAETRQVAIETISRHIESEFAYDFFKAVTVFCPSAALKEIPDGRIYLVVAHVTDDFLQRFAADVKASCIGPNFGVSANRFMAVLNRRNEIPAPLAAAIPSAEKFAQLVNGMMKHDAGMAIFYRLVKFLLATSPHAVIVDVATESAEVDANKFSPWILMDMINIVNALIG